MRSEKFSDIIIQLLSTGKPLCIAQRLLRVILMVLQQMQELMRLILWKPASKIRPSLFIWLLGHFAISRFM